MKRFRPAVPLILALLALRPAATLAQASPALETITCEEIQRHPLEVLSRNIDLGTSVYTPTDVDFDCPGGLQSLPFLHRLLSLAETIRGSQPCNGRMVYALSRYYCLGLLRAGFVPDLFLQQNEQGKLEEGGMGAGGLSAAEKLDYFTAWSLKSPYNFRLYRAFLSEYDRALPRLAAQYRQRFGFPQEKAGAVARQALQFIADRAFGVLPSRLKVAAPTPLVRLSMDRTSAVADLRAGLAATPPPGQEEIDQALKAALLFGRPLPYLSLLVESLETLNRGDEPAIFFALGNPEDVKLLLEHGAAVDSANGFGKTPLFYAIERGDLRVVELLLDHGADVNHPYNRSRTPEEEEAEFQAKLGGKSILDFNYSQVDACPYQIRLGRRTPLMHAAQHADVRMLALLIRRGALLGALDDAEDFHGNALDYAAGRPANAAFLRSLGLRPHRAG